MGNSIPAYGFYDEKGTPFDPLVGGFYQFMPKITADARILKWGKNRRSSVEIELGKFTLFG
jgi:hypothetical protein